MRKKLLIGFLLIFTVMVAIMGCGGDAAEPDNAATSGDGSEDKKPLQIYASFYPLYDFAQKIGGDAVEVHSMVPPGAEPHDFEPAPQDMVALAEADLFVYNGAGFESWAEKAVEILDAEKTHIVNATEHLDMLTNEESGHHHDHDHGDGHEDDDHDHDHGHGDGHEDGDHDHDHGHGDGHEDDDHDHGDGHDHHHHHHGEFDPHVWVDPTLAKQQAEAIKDALVEIDSDNREMYEMNFEQLEAQFDELDEMLQNVAQNANRKEIIVSHAAFGYLTHKYGLEQIAISGLSPSSEPSQKQLQEIVEFAKEHNIKYIMFETLVSTKVAEVVKNEVGAEALTLNPLENLTKEELEQGEDYFSIMKKNIENIEKALSS